MKINTYIYVLENWIVVAFFTILIPLKRRDINKDKENDEIHKILKLNYFSFLL